MKHPKGPRKYKLPEVLISERGTEIQTKYIDKAILRRHMLVESIFENVEALRQDMIAVKKCLFEEIEKYLEETAISYGEYWQGNASLMNFDKTKKVSLKNSKIMKFDERLNIAKSKIDKFISSRSEGIDDMLRELIMSAFNVDKQGNVDVSMIVSLKQHKFPDPLWQEAMQIIDAALMVDYTKKYLNFEKRGSSKEQAWESIVLTFAVLPV